MTETYLLLGCNEGNCSQNLEYARQLIQRQCGEIRLCSSLYKTQAWGLTNQSDFLNQAIQIQTSLNPEKLLTNIKEIEIALGRKNTEQWGPRPIDIDILLYGNEIVQLPQLQIPHLYLPERRFSLTPLSEIAPDVVHPVLRKSIKQLLKECKDQSDVTKWRASYPDD